MEDRKQDASKDPLQYLPEQKKLKLDPQSESPQKLNRRFSQRIKLNTIANELNTDKPLNKKEQSNGIEKSVKALAPAKTKRCSKSTNPTMTKTSGFNPDYHILTYTPRGMKILDLRKLMKDCKTDVSKGPLQYLPEQKQLKLDPRSKSLKKLDKKSSETKVTTKATKSKPNKPIIKKGPSNTIKNSGETPVPAIPKRCSKSTDLTMTKNSLSPLGHHCSSYSPSGPPENLNMQYACVTCSQAPGFLLKVPLEREQEVITNQRNIMLMNFEKLKCRACFRIFSTRDQVEKHEKYHHKKAFHPCKICGELFLTQFDLQKHSSQEHLAKNRSICKVCYLDFCDSPSLSRHLRVAHDMIANKTPQKFECICCHNEFGNKIKFIQHIRDDHQNHALVVKASQGKENGTPKTKCPHCSSHFKNPKLRAVHEIIFHETPPYRCFCNEAFFTKATCDEHTLKHTKTMMEHMKVIKSAQRSLLKGKR